MLIVLDNFDSFTFTLADYLASAGAEVRVVRADAASAADMLASDASGFVVSPGPGHPADARVALDLVAGCTAARRPLLGVCLGQQAIGLHFGARVERAPVPVHGRPSPIRHDGSGLFAGLPSPFPATRYNSLTLAPASLPSSLVAAGWADDDGTLQALRHHTLPIHAVQFHPESIASEGGRALLANFVSLSGG